MLERCSRRELVSAVSVKLPESNSHEVFYRFTHEKIQQASYSMINPVKQSLFHLTLGRILRDKMKAADTSELLLLTADQLNRGRALIDDEEERLQLVRHNLASAITSKERSAFFPASDFIDVALELLAVTGWADQYKLYLETLTIGAELDYCCANTERCQLRVEQILQRAKTLADKQKAFFVLIHLHTQNRNHEEALDVGYDFLRKYGVDVARRGRMLSVVYEYKSLLPQINKLSDKELLGTPKGEDEQITVIIKMMQSLLGPAHWTKRDYEYGYMVVTMMKLTMKHGGSNMAGAVFSAFAGACALFGDFDVARRISSIAQEFDLTTSDQVYRCKSKIYYISFIAATQSAYYLSLDPFLEAHRIASEVGSVEDASLCSLAYVMTYYLAGLPLQSMVKDAKMFSSRMLEVGQLQHLSILKLYHQCALNLMGEASVKLTMLQGEAIDDIGVFLLSDIDGVGNPRALQHFSGLDMQIAYYFRDFEMSLNAATENEAFGDSDWPLFFSQVNPFFRCLVWIEAARRKRRRSYVRKAKSCIKKMEKGLHNGMVNLHHMLLIAKAEFHTLRCKSWQVNSVKVAFDEAAKTCTRSGFTQNAALANELCARFMMRNDDNDWAMYYAKRAVELYGEWGADGKAFHLVDEFKILATSARRLTTKRTRITGFRGRSRFKDTDHSDTHRGQHVDRLWSVSNSFGSSSLGSDVLQDSLKNV